MNWKGMMDAYDRLALLVHNFDAGHDFTLTDKDVAAIRDALDWRDWAKDETRRNQDLRTDKAWMLQCIYEHQQECPLYEEQPHDLDGMPYPLRRTGAA